MKVNTRMLSDGSHEKVFAKNAFNSEKINFDIKSEGASRNIPFGYIYLPPKKLLKLWHFVSPQAPIPRSDMFFMNQ